MNGSDPIRERRARIDALARLGQRIGYGCFGLAMAAFVIGFVTDFGTWGPVVTGLLLAGSVVLAPAIVAGYGVKAGEREDRERGV